MEVCVIYLLKVEIYIILCIAASDNFFLPCTLYFERPLNNYCTVAPHVCKTEGGKNSGRQMKSVPKMEVKIMNWLEHLAVAETMAVVASEMPGVSSRAPAIVIFWQPRSASPTILPLVLQNPLREDLYIKVCIQKSLGFRRYTSVSTGPAS